MRDTRHQNSAIASLALLAVLAGASSQASEAPTRAYKAPGERLESTRAERTLLQTPNDRGARLAAARAHLHEGAEIPSRLVSARQHAIAVLEQNPNDVEALLLAGQVSLLQNDASAAARYYRAASSADSTSAAAFLGLGDALKRVGDDSGADAAFERFRRLTQTTSQ